MSKRRAKGVVYMPLAITAAMFVVFNDRINCQANEAGFWLILALGISIGVILRSLFKN